MADDEDRIGRMVDFGLDEALVSFDMPLEPTEEEVAAVEDRLKKDEEQT